MVAAIHDRCYLLDVPCFQCERVFVVNVNRNDLVDWSSGSGPIEKILYYLSDGERELLLSNTCGECFDKLFPLDNDE